MKIEIANDEFIKWTSKDTDGEFSESGLVLSQTDNDVTFKTLNGVNTIPWKNGEFCKTKAFDFPERVDVKEEVTTPVVAKVKRAPRDPKTGTKLEQALVIYANLEDKSRKNVIDTFVKELQMTPAGASTYQSTCKKKLG